MIPKPTLKIIRRATTLMTTPRSNSDIFNNEMDAQITFLACKLICQTYQAHPFICQSQQPYQFVYQNYQAFKICINVDYVIFLDFQS